MRNARTNTHDLMTGYWPSQYEQFQAKLQHRTTHTHLCISLTLAFDTSSLFPLSCNQIWRDILLPCDCPVQSRRPIIVKATLKTCSTRGLAHFSSSCLSSRTVNSSTVGGSCFRWLPAAESLLVGWSEQFSSVTRFIPRRGRVVDILFSNNLVAVHTDALLFCPFVAMWESCPLRLSYPVLLWGWFVNKATVFIFEDLS